MAYIIQDAARGAQSAMLALYKVNKKKVWSIAQSLLQDSEQASNATVAVFREMWRELRNGEIKTTEAFTDAAVNKTAEICSAAILQKNPRAFRIPFDKDFHLSEGFPVNLRPEGEIDYYLTNLPALQRLIFVLHTFGGWGALRIARVLQWDSGLVRTAMETEADTFGLLQQLSGRDYHDDYEQVLGKFLAWEQAAVIPEQTEKQILATIQELSTEEGEQAKRNRIVLTCIGVFLCALAIWIALLPALRKANNNAGSNDAETTADVDTTETGEASTEETEEDDGYLSPASLDSDIDYYAELEIDGYDMITIKLDPKSAPESCAAFVYACEMGHYDFQTIYQADDNTIHGGLSSSFGMLVHSEESPLEVKAGAITLAPVDNGSTASQFVLFREDQTDLNGQYPVFGYVIEGMEVLEQICDDMIYEEDGSIEESNQPVIYSLTIWEEDNSVEYED